MRPRPTPAGVPTRVVCAGPEVEGPDARAEDSSPPRRPANIHYQDDSVTLHLGDCRKILPALPGDSVDSVVCDPPYELGFMGKGWDSSGIAYDVSMWREVWRVLKPGGHLLAFGGTRTWHRLACAVEDAGFEIRDSIAWMYGSGFPKSLDVSKAIDKLDATDIRRARNLSFTKWMRSTGITAKALDLATDSFMGGHYLTEREQAAVPTAEMFALIRPLLAVEVPGWVEALILERSVESENFAARAVIGERSTGRGTGKGSVAVITDSGNYDVTVAHTPEAEQWQGWGTALKPAFEPIVVARKPLIGTVASNVLTHSTGALNIDACRIGREDGDRTEYGRGRHLPHANTTASLGRFNEVTPYAPHEDGRWPANVILDESQADALDEQSGETSSKSGGRTTNALGAMNDDGWIAQDLPRTGHDDEGGASRFFYVAKAGADERPCVDGIAHPTVKPLDLMRWLVRLVTPPGGTVLEPFAGSGTTVEACIIEHFRCIAIEKTDEYLPLIESRIARRRDPVRAIELNGEDMGLFGIDGEASA